MIETSAGELDFKSILHVAVPDKTCGENTAEKHLGSIVYDCLDWADAGGHNSIVFPPLGDGRFRIPEAKIARVMVKTIKRYVLDRCNSCTVDSFIICVEKESYIPVFLKELSEGLGNMAYPKPGKG